MANRIVGFFKDPGQAGQTILALVNAGYARADIDLFYDENFYVPNTEMHLEQGSLSAHYGGARVDHLPSLLEIPGTLDAYDGKPVPREQVNAYVDGVHQGGAVISIGVPEFKVEQTLDLLRSHGLSERSSGH